MLSAVILIVMISEILMVIPLAIIDGIKTTARKKRKEQDIWKKWSV